MLKIATNQPSELYRNLSILKSLKSGENVSLESGFIRPFSLLPLCAYAFENNISLAVSPSSSADSKSYLATIKFPSGIRAINIKKEKTSSYVPITRITRKDDESSLNNLLDDFSKLVSSASDDEVVRCCLRDHFNYALSELAENYREHSFSENLWLFVQKFNNSRELEFCIVDNGIGIRERFNRANIQFKDDLEAVKSAVDGVSAKAPFSELKGDQGHGLADTIRLITKTPLNGKIIFISGNAFYNISSGNNSVLFNSGLDWQGVIFAGKLSFPKVFFPITDYIR